jgi:hypothetical protein
MELTGGTETADVNLFVDVEMLEFQNCLFSKTPQQLSVCFNFCYSL